MLALGIDRTTAILATLRERFGDALSPRVEAMVRHGATADKAPLPPGRGAKQLFLPSLETRPWWDPSAFAWIADIEAATDAIYAEYGVAVLARHDPLCRLPE